MALLDTVRRYYELVDADDVDGLLALFADDGVYHRPGYEPLVGIDAIAAFYRGTRVIRKGRHTVANEVVDPAGRVACEGSFDGVLKDGRVVSLRWADFWTFDATAKVRRRDSYFFVPLV